MIEKINNNPDFIKITPLRVQKPITLDSNNYKIIYDSDQFQKRFKIMSRPLNL